MWHLCEILYMLYLYLTHMALEFSLCSTFHLLWLNDVHSVHKDSWAFISSRSFSTLTRKVLPSTIFSPALVWLLCEGNQTVYCKSDLWYSGPMLLLENCQIPTAIITGRHPIKHPNIRLLNTESIISQWFQFLWSVCWHPTSDFQIRTRANENIHWSTQKREMLILQTPALFHVRLFYTWFVVLVIIIITIIV
jgi:hypothetical protein